MACPPTPAMTWLEFRFNTNDMTVTIPEDKLADIIAFGVPVGIQVVCKYS